MLQLQISHLIVFSLSYFGNQTKFLNFNITHQDMKVAQSSKTFMKQKKLHATCERATELL